jgi:hypothetical protein
MLRRIPVFAFAFAAYAVSSGRSDAKGAAPLRPPFMETWLSSGRRGDLLVKIEIRGEESRATAESGGSVVAGAQEVWLGDIAETEHGFSGAVCAAQTPLKRIRLGQRIAFDPTRILDWTISYYASAGGTAERARACDTIGS